MIKVLGIISSGKFHETSKLLTELLKCPECKIMGFHTDTGKFEAWIDGETFVITCNKCNCKFRVSVEEDKF